MPTFFGKRNATPCPDPLDSTGDDWNSFEWDRRKDSAKRRKHNIGFDEATTVFDDPLSITIGDPDHAIDEERFVIIGMSNTQNLLIVVHTIARRANPRDQRSLSYEARKTQI